jgi:hypothetical protein
LVRVPSKAHGKRRCRLHGGAIGNGTACILTKPSPRARCCGPCCANRTNFCVSCDDHQPAKPMADRGGRQSQRHEHANGDRWRAVSAKRLVLPAVTASVIPMPPVGAARHKRAMTQPGATAIAVVVHGGSDDHATPEAMKVMKAAEPMEAAEMMSAAMEARGSNRSWKGWSSRHGERICGDKRC